MEFAQRVLLANLRWIRHVKTVVLGHTEQLRRNNVNHVPLEGVPFPGFHVKIAHQVFTPINLDRLCVYPVMAYLLHLHVQPAVLDALVRQYPLLLPVNCVQQDIGLLQIPPNVLNVILALPNL